MNFSYIIYNLVYYIADIEFGIKRGGIVISGLFYKINNESGRIKAALVVISFSIHMFGKEFVSDYTVSLLSRGRGFFVLNRNKNRALTAAMTICDSNTDSHVPQIPKARQVRRI